MTEISLNSIQSQIAIYLDTHSNYFKLFRCKVQNFLLHRNYSFYY